MSVRINLHSHQETVNFLYKLHEMETQMFSMQCRLIAM